jgi:tRNA threonylcarbamoyladenosine biosynthesis protein TsaB
VGISTAKGLAFSLGIPIVGISTLSLAAYQHAYSGLPICPIFDARRGEIDTAIYQMKTKDWCQIMSDCLTTPESLSSHITSETIFCGDLTADISAKLVDSLGDKAIIPSLVFRLRRAALLIELGQRELAAGKADNPATLQPLYLRRPAITRPRKR